MAIQLQVITIQAYSYSLPLSGRGLPGGVGTGDEGFLGDNFPLLIMLSWQLFGARKQLAGMVAMVYKYGILAQGESMRKRKKE